MNPLSRGLVMHLPLDNIQGGQVIDVSGRSNDGTVHGAPQLIADDIFGWVIQFDGVNDYIDLGNPTDLQITGNQTIELWLKRTVLNDTARRNPFAKAFGGEGTITQEPSGLFTYYYGTGGGNSEPYQDHINTTQPIANDTWTHIAVVRDFGRGKVRWYIAGALQFEVAAQFNSAAVSTQNAYIGQGYVNRYKGAMAHLRVYERALSEEEIRRDMHMDSARLMLHLKFDKIVENKIIDAAGNGLNAIVNGNPRIVADEIFGESLALNGSTDYLTIADNPLLRIGPYTVEMWIKPDGAPNEVWKGIVGKPGRNYNIWLHNSGFIHHRFHVGTNTNMEVPDTQPGTILWDQWNHVAITNDEQTATTYINGAWAVGGPTGGQLVIDNQPLIIGRNLDGNTGNNFKGQIADLRIYQGVLPIQAIKRDMDEDRAASDSFHTTHPIDFKLLNDDQQQVLLIDDDPAGHKAYLEITNTASQTLRLTGVGNVAPSTDNHHFELRFRADVLADACLDITQPDHLVSLTGDGWQLSAPQHNGHTVSFYIASTIDRTFAPHVTLLLTLNHLIADGGGGSRGARLELHYQNLTYIDETTPVEGSWVEQLNIVNHRGKKNIPLHVGFLGSNTILNDQGRSESYLVLSIGNLLEAEAIALLPEAQSSSPSQFVILFDHEPNQQAPWQKPWALGTGTDLKDVTVSAAGITEITNLDLGDWRVEIEGTEGLSTEITLTPKTKTTLAPREVVKIPLQKIRSSLPAGHANLYVHYKNIPGYWDGQFVVVVEKSPLIMRGDRVGIGVANPQTTLHVKGNVKYEGWLETKNNFKMLVEHPGGTDHNRTVMELEPRYKDDIARSRVFLYAPNHYYDNIPAITLAAKYGAGSHVGVGLSEPGGQLHVVNENQDANGNTLILGPVNQSHLRLGYHQNYSWIQSHGAKPLIINPVGSNVGIGTDNPGQKLVIQGSHNSGKQAESGLQYGGNLAIVSNAPQIDFIDTDNNDWSIHVNSNKFYFIRQPWNYKDLVLDGAGNVGIGTDTPKDILQIAEYQAGDRYIKLTTQGGNQYKTGLKLWVWQDNHGFTIENNEKYPANGLHVMQHNASDKTTKTSLFVRFGDGNIGIDTTNPNHKLTVAGGHVQIDTNRVMGTNPTDKFSYDGKDMGHYSIGWFNDSWFQWGSTAWISGYGGFKFFTNGSPKLTMDYHGNIRYTTSLEKSSTRDIKADIVALSPQEALSALAGLHPVKYTLKADDQKRPQLGFIAEETPEVIATEDRKAINPDHVIAVLTRVVKEQQQLIEGLEAKVKRLIEK